MKHAKRIGALICVIAICFTLMAAPSAHAVGALGGQAAGALIGAGLVALNIVADIAIGSIGNYFGWQAHPTSTTLLQQDIQYTFPVASQFISDYMNASTIKVNQGVINIDGVDYDEVFISPGTFTNGLKTNLFDFKTKWNLLTGQAGTLASGYGYIDGTPVYRLTNGTIMSTYYTFGQGSTVWGNGTLQAGQGSNYKWMDYIDSLGTRHVSGAMNNEIPISDYQMYKVIVNGHPNIGRKTSTAGPYFMSSMNDSLLVQEPFEYTYTNGIVPTNPTDIPDDYGLSIQIPHEQLQTFYNTYPQYNVDNSVINIQQDQIDIDQLTQAIFDRITSMDDIHAEWKAEEEPVPPEPGPPVPVPPEPAEDVLEGVNTLAEQQYESNQIQYQDYMIQQQQLQQQQQQLQQQQQINENTSDIKEALENATETPSKEDLPDFKFDLRELFPFCIPFDIYRLLSSFDSQPEAPHIQLPIVINSINFRYTLDLDFSAWNPVAQAMRTAELIVYAIGLAWATGKVIKW